MNPANPQSQTARPMLGLALWCAAVDASEQGVRLEQALAVIPDGDTASLQCARSYN